MTERRQQELEIFALIEPTVARSGFELVAVEFIVSDGRRTLRVSVDAPGGVSVGDCGVVSHALSPLLDVEDPVSGAYFLEVSSPGIKRPLQRTQDFDRFTGYRVRILLEPGLGRRRYKGVLKGLDGANLDVEVDGVVHTLAADTIERAHLILELDEYQALSAAVPSNPAEPNTPDRRTSS